MESRGRRTPRMAAPVENPTPQAAPEVPDSVNIDKPVEETFAPAEVVAERISPPVPAPDPLPAPASAPVLLPETAPPVSLPASSPLSTADRNFFDLIADSRAVLARGVESISDELASFARHSIDTTVHTAVQMLGVRTWADAVAVNTSFARASLDRWLDSTAKVSELGVKLAIESSKPFVTKIGEAWSRAHDGR
jgi:hypothetical protein